MKIPKIYEITEEWLEQLNEEFRKNDVLHKDRPWLAFDRWDEEGNSINPSIGDDEAKFIFEWFEKNTKSGSQNMPPIFIGAYYFDSCFWKVLIYPIAGNKKIYFLNSLKDIPEKIKKDISNNNDLLANFGEFWANCLDYGFEIDALIDVQNSGSFGQKLLKSGDQHLRSCVSLLLENEPSSKAIEQARMSVEMFLKAFLAIKVGLTEKEAFKISHDLNKALEKYLLVDAKSELQTIQSKLNVFPEIKDRYEGNERKGRELWEAYKTAQFVATTVIRSFSNRDTRKSFFVN